MVELGGWVLDVIKEEVNVIQAICEYECICGEFFNMFYDQGQDVQFGSKDIWVSWKLDNYVELPQSIEYPHTHNIDITFSIRGCEGTVHVVRVEGGNCSGCITYLLRAWGGVLVSVGVIDGGWFVCHALGIGAWVGGVGLMG